MSLEILVGDRRSGKTNEMLFWLQDHPGAVMVCHSQHEVARLLEEFPFLEPGQLANPRNVRQRMLGKSPRQLGVDNLDLVLHNLFGACPSRATSTTNINVRTVW